MKNSLSLLFVTLLTSLLYACGGGSGGSSNGSSNDSSSDNSDNVRTTDTSTESSQEGRLNLELSAILLNDSANKLAFTYSQTTCPSGNSDDNPDFGPGLDCDSDGGVVSYVTPSVFKAAIKSLVLIDEDDNEVSLIADSGTLAEATIFDLSNPETLALTEIPTGNYESLEAEIYYYELTMPLYDASEPQTLRVYLSDDNFEAEGELGHHQGDITLIIDDEEAGWVGAGVPWDTNNLLSTRDGIEGGGGEDPETGHSRGLYGDTNLWNSSDFEQGENQDIYLLTMDAEFELDADQVIDMEIEFDLTESWYYEDFDDNQLFNPCTGDEAINDACHEQASWSPIFPEPEVFIESSETDSSDEEDDEEEVDDEESDEAETS